MSKTLYRAYTVYEPHEIPKEEFNADFIRVVNNDREEEDLYAPLCEFKFCEGRLIKVYIPDGGHYGDGTWFSRWYTEDGVEDDEVMYEEHYWDKNGVKEGTKEERRQLRFLFAAVMHIEQWDSISPL